MISGSTRIQPTWVSRKASRTAGSRIRVAQSQRKINGTRLCRCASITKWYAG